MYFILVQDGFKCEICFVVLWTSVERNQHILNHFQKSECSFCQQKLILIGDIWFSPHEHTNHNVIKDEIIANDVDEFMLEPVLLPDFVGIKSDPASCYQEENNVPVDPYGMYDPIDHTFINTNSDENPSEMDYSDMVTYQSAAGVPDTIEHEPKEIFLVGNDFDLEANVDDYNGNTPNESHQSVTDSTVIDKTICPICNKKIKCKTSMKYHLNIHRNLKPYVCTSCDAAYADRRNLLAHTKKHNHKMPAALKRGNKRKHSNDQNWDCTFCYVDFESEANLIDHLKIHHRNESILQRKTPKKISLEKINQIDTGNVINSEIIASSQQTDELQGKKHTSPDAQQIPDPNDETVCPGDDSSIVETKTLTGGICKICKKKFVCKTGLKYHMNLHLGLKPFECDVCERSFADKRNLTAHKKIHKPLPDIIDDFMEIVNDKVVLSTEQLNTLVCPICDRSFGSKNGLRYHVGVHDKEKYLCKLCGKKFREKSNYDRHRITHKNEIESQVVPELSIRDYDDTHRENEQNVAIDWVCEYCNGDFEFEIRLARHILKEHDETKTEHLCNICEQRFSLPNELLMHMRAHPESTQYKCNYQDCTQGFCYKSSLGVHLDKHNRINGRIEKRTQDQLTELTKQHAILKNSDDNSSAACSSKDSLRCSKCNKSFPSRTNLLTHHQVVHTNERLKCTVAGCGKIFKTLQGIGSHIKNIHPESIKTCRICKKTFYTEEKLSEHQRLKHNESGEKISFACNLCEKVFPRKHALRLHLTQHDKDATCNVCNEKFASVKQMMQHRERHGKKPVITCRFKDCNMVFENRSEFFIHSSQHPSSDKKRCICNICGKFLSSKLYHLFLDH